MTQNQPGEASKIQSLYPDLQAVLPKLSALNPDAADPRPVFDNRAKARLFIDIQTDDSNHPLVLMPVWEIDHNDLDASHIGAWSVTSRPC